MPEDLDFNIPFALYSFPGSKDWTLLQGAHLSQGCITHLNRIDWNGFFINFFGNQEPYIAGIPAGGLPNSTIHWKPKIHPTLTSTLRNQHEHQVSAAVEMLANPDNNLKKVVLSRITSVESSVSPMQALQGLSSAFPGTFRYLCNLPETGIWLAATPEVLIDLDTLTGQLQTMALAGTLPLGCEWDDKNRTEQLYVTRFITSTLQSLGFQIHVSPVQDLVFGEIKHLCTRISASANSPINAETILKALSPTPAVCGTPRDLAMNVINSLESFPRHCYGGFVGIKQGSRVRAFVNLRCAFAEPISSTHFLYNIYAGGGITRSSVPCTEWEETQAKGAKLISLLTPN